MSRSLLPVLAQQAEANAATARSLALMRDRSAQLRDLIVGDAVSLRQVEQRHDRALEDLRRSVRSVERASSGCAPPRRPCRSTTTASPRSSAARRPRSPSGSAAYVGLFRGAAPVVDLGCGRGEFLDLLRREDIQARGVDVSAAMVSRCKEKGLDAERRGAAEYLAGLKDDSLGGAFSAQLIEHLHVNEVVRLVRLLRKRLRAGGVLVVEAPNPRSFRVLSDFTLDPTHARLHHPDFMRWLLEHEGYDVDDVLYSLPEPENEAQLDDPLNAPQAYAIVARRSGEARPTGGSNR